MAENKNERSEADSRKALADAEETVKRLRNEHAAIQHELGQSRQMLEMVLNTIPTRVFWKDRNSTFLGCNLPFARDTGLESPEDVVGLDDYRAAWRSHAERYRSEDREVMSSGQPLLNYEDTRISPDGTERFLRTSKMPLRNPDGEIVGLLGCYDDITESKQALEALRDSELKYRRLVEDISEILFAADAAGKVTFIGPAIEKLTGYAPGEVVGKHYTEFIHPDDRERITRRFRDAVAGKANPSNYRVLTKGGDTRWVRVSSRPTMVDDAFAGLRGVLCDITEQRALQEQLRQAQRLEAVGQLAGGVAHDFNNLLMVIVNSAEFVKESIAGDSEAADDVERIFRAANQAAKVAGQLLAFSRRQVLRMRALDLNATLADAKDMLGRLIGEDVAFAFTPGPDLSSVKADPTQIQQAVVNIVVNARESMPRGGKLSIKTSNTVLTDSDRHRFPDMVEFKPGDYVCISISDTGCGMPNDVRTRVFEPFFTTKGLALNSGLGLSTVYGIVRQHDGYVTVRSEPGQGSTFEIFLPSHADKPELQTQAEGESGPGSDEETILLVEDDDQVRRIEARILRGLGYNVLEAASGAEAIEIAGQGDAKVNLLFTDVVMPGMDGKTLADKLTAQYPALKVILTSGYPENRVTKLGAPAEGVGFVQKPFSRQDVAGKIRALLDMP